MFYCFRSLHYMKERICILLTYVLGQVVLVNMSYGAGMGRVKVLA